MLRTLFLSESEWGDGEEDKAAGGRGTRLEFCISGVPPLLVVGTSTARLLEHRGFASCFTAALSGGTLQNSADDPNKGDAACIRAFFENGCMGLGNVISD